MIGTVKLPTGSRLIEIVSGTAGLVAIFLPVVGFAVRWAGYWSRGGIPVEAALARSLPELAVDGLESLVNELPTALFLIIFAWVIFLRAAKSGPSGSADDAAVPADQAPHVDAQAPPAAPREKRSRVSPLRSLVQDLGSVLFLVAVILFLLVLFLVAPDFPLSLLLAAFGGPMGVLISLFSKGTLTATVTHVFPLVLVTMVVLAVSDGAAPAHAVVPQQVVFGPGTAILQSGRYAVLGATDVEIYLLGCSGGPVIAVQRSRVESISSNQATGMTLSRPSLWGLLFQHQVPASFGLQLDCSP